MAIAKKEILILDDDPDLRTLLRRILEGQGVVVTEAETVEQAILSLKTRSPHMVFSDINLIGETGWDFLEQKSKFLELKNIPVVMLTSNADKKHIAKSMGLGAQDYMIKPLNAKAIIQKIKKVLKDFTIPPFIYKDDAPKFLRAKIQATLVEINEVTCVVHAPLKIPKGELIKIDSDFLEFLGADVCDLKIIAESKSTETVGHYKNEFTFVGMDDKISKNIRKIQTIAKR